jgi:serine/threonine protein kinase
VADIDAVVIANRYRLVRTLGEGGMGRVWAACDELLDRDVALKEVVLERGLSQDEMEESRQRAIREARSIARIVHPNVVGIFDVVIDSGSPWIVMELVESGDVVGRGKTESGDVVGRGKTESGDVVGRGKTESGDVVGRGRTESRSLFEAIREDGPMAPQEVARVGLSVLAGLRAAHEAGVLHRDVKPANVLLATGGRTVLTDFGLATASGDSSITRSGILLGSPSYLAPERALGENASPASDLWSLGATLYAAVEGQPPYEKSTPVATLAALATVPPRPARRAGVMGPVLDALLVRDPAGRADAATAERLLHAAAEGVEPEPVQAAEPTPSGEEDANPDSEPSLAGGSVATGTATTVEVKLSQPRRHRLLAAVVGAALLTVAVAVLPAVISNLAGAPTPSRTADELSRDRQIGAVEPTPSSDLARPAAPAVPEPATPAAQVPGVQVPGAQVLTDPATSAWSKPSTAAPPGPAVPAAGPTAPPPGPAIGREFKNMQTATCLQLNTATGAIEMWRCDGRGAQKFDVRADRTLRVLGRCVQIEGTTDGARLGTGDCTGELAQQFDYNTSYDLVNLLIIKCVDVTDGSPGSGVPAQVWECSGNGNQKWWH